jgi:hypothetical protein
MAAVTAAAMTMVMAVVMTTAIIRRAEPLRARLS